MTLEEIMDALDEIETKADNRQDFISALEMKLDILRTEQDDD